MRFLGRGFGPAFLTPLKQPVKTTAWITYDRKYLYVASDQDFLGIFLDTRDDRRSALELFVNAQGIRLEPLEFGGRLDTTPTFFEGHRKPSPWPVTSDKSAFRVPGWGVHPPSSFPISKL